MQTLSIDTPSSYFTLKQALFICSQNNVSDDVLKGFEMKTFNFSANWVDFGEWEAETLTQAKDDFASDSGYKNWDDMVDRCGHDAFLILEMP